MTTTTMGVREVTRSTSEVFDRTSNGETIVVTKRGRVVGIITPPQAYSPQLTELIASGAVLPPAVPGGSAALLAMPVPTGEAKDSAADLDAVREDRA
ncbi:MAG: type II toxin-antitoxin system Phd/YefM family antitoxin [Streptosporangiaceae bacterium]